ncbi:hypothetical protein V1525DRAFT_441884 [Lipomyces kononenkoae]|uniref:Uncharacterized protein n=1 Tax=Lipomyces kononenkoae TaxID=34357 RepID=A0ACC3T3X3_LIPKO
MAEASGGPEAKIESTPSTTYSWLISKGAIPIPGTTKIARLEENVKAAHLELTKAEVDKINEFVENADVASDSYPSS